MSDGADEPIDRIDELIALAAMGELTAAEQAELDAALAVPEIEADLRGALDTAAALQQPTESDVPERLRAAVLGAIDNVEQVDAVDTTPDATKNNADVVDLASRRRRRLTAALSAAAAAVLFVGVGVAIVATDEGDDPIEAVVEADDTVVRTLSGDLAGELEVTHSATEDAIVVIGVGLEPVDPALTLQLWLVTDDQATPVGTFRPDGDGRVSERFDGIDPTGVALGVTREPASGSQTPTLPILASA